MPEECQRNTMRNVRQEVRTELRQLFNDRLVGAYATHYFCSRFHHD